MDTMTDAAMEAAGKPIGVIRADGSGEPEAPAVQRDRFAEDKKIAVDALKALEVARESLAAEAAGRNDAGQEPVEVDVSAGVESDGQLASAKDSADAGPIRVSSLTADNAQPEKVEITEEDKSAFIQSLVTGSRYRRDVTILDGRIRIGLRARTVGESEAIDSYIRRRVNDGTIRVGIEYSDMMRLCLLVFDVERLGDETFPEAAKPLMAVSTADGVSEPEWVKSLDIWREKPEGLVNAILPEVFKFETKYAEMVKHGSDENFWRTGGSTGA